MEEEQSLHEEILGVCRSGLKNTFVDQGEADERKYPKLAGICENVEPEKWEKWERPQALISTMRRAIELMPDGKPRNSPVSWKRIARTLCGFRSDLELRPGEVAFSYKMDYIPALKLESGLPERTLGRHVESSRKLLANALLELERQVIASKDGSFEGEEYSSEDPGAHTVPKGESPVGSVVSHIHALFVHSPVIGSSGTTQSVIKRSVLLPVLSSVVALAAVSALLILEPWTADDPQEQTEHAVGDPALNFASAPAAPLDGSEPVITTRVIRGNICEGGLMVPEKSIADLGVPPEEVRYDAGIQEWARDNHDALSTVTGVGFTIQGTTEAAIVLEEMKVEVEEPRGEAPDGVILTYPCGEEIDARFAVADLDTSPVTFESELPGKDRSLYSDHMSRRYSPMQFPYQVSMSESEYFLLVPATQSCDCEWYIRIRWSSMGEEGEIAIDDDGKPFRTISPSKMDPYELIGESWQIPSWW